MDLATCKEKLLSGKYSTYEEVFDDIQLIWENCKLYNMVGCDIYKVCERMEKTAKRNIQKFRSAHGLPQPATQAPQSGLRKRSAAKPESRGPIGNEGRQSGPSGSGRGASNYEESKQAATMGDAFEFGDGGRSNDKVTVDMKMDLVAKVKKLSNEGLTKLVKHI